jgi:hypothetical protein
LVAARAGVPYAGRHLKEPPVCTLALLAALAVPPAPAADREGLAWDGGQLLAYLNSHGLGLTDRGTFWASAKGHRLFVRTFRTPGEASREVAHLRRIYAAPPPRPAAALAWGRFSLSSGPPDLAIRAAAALGAAVPPQAP